MGIEELENREYISFSEEAITKSETDVFEYVNRKGKDIDLVVLTSKVDEDMLSILGTMLDNIAQERITEDSTDLEIDTFNETLHRKEFFQWNPKLRNILGITFVKKVLENLQYTNQNVNEELIRDLYLQKYTEDISYIWLSALREKLRDK